MAELLLPNFYQNWSQAQARGDDRGRRSKLAELSSQAFAAPAEQQSQLVGQAIGVDPDAGFGLNKALQGNEDHRKEQLANLAKGWKQIPREQKQAYYERFVAPAVSSMGFGDLGQYNETEVDGIANQILAAYGQADAGANSVQSRFVGDDGMVYAMMRDGTPVNTGIKADRQMWLRDHAGQSPHLVGKNGEVIPVGGGQGDPVQGASGMPFQIDPQGMPPAVVQAIQSGEQQAGNRPWTANTPDIVGGRAPIPQDAYDRVLGGGRSRGGGGLARPSEAQTAAEVERAKQRAQLEALPIELGLRTDAAVDQAVRTEAGKTAVEKAAAAPAAIATLQTSIDSIDSLLNDPDLGSIVGFSSMNPLNQVPGTKARGLIARADQIAGQSFLAAFNQLKGGGAITEREGEAATKAMARLDRSQSEADYKAALRELKSALTPAMTRLKQQAAGAAPTVPGTAPVRRKYNPATGRLE
jgi:hypothetical protein